jgi:acetyltransferase-like isoleucine patch superfamily enzyme
MERLLLVWWLIKTQALWGWRFHSLGRHSLIGKCRCVADPKSIAIGHHTTLHDCWTLANLDPGSADRRPKIRIGSHCSIMWDFQCNASVSVEVQDYVLIAPRVFITDSDHVVDAAGQRTTVSNCFRSAPVVIEHDCWLGVNAVILKGVRVGHHAVVGANAVVTTDVEPNAIVAGVPARAIGRRKCQ